MRWFENLFILFWEEGLSRWRGCINIHNVLLISLYLLNMLVHLMQPIPDLPPAILHNMPGPASCSLHWVDYVPTVAGMLRQFYQEQDFTDVTLVCDDGIITAHSIVLSACSLLFSSLLKKEVTSQISIHIANTTASHLQSLLALL